MAVRERKTVYLDSDLTDSIERLAKVKGGRRMGSTFSDEANRLLRQALQFQQANDEQTTVAPILQELLDTRLSQIDRHLASMIAKTGVDTATCLHLFLRLISGEPVENLEETYTEARRWAMEHFKAKESGLPTVRESSASGGDR